MNLIPTQIIRQPMYAQRDSPIRLNGSNCCISSTSLPTGSGKPRHFLDIYTISLFETIFLTGQGGRFLPSIGTDDQKLKVVKKKVKKKRLGKPTAKAKAKAKAKPAAEPKVTAFNAAPAVHKHSAINNTNREKCGPFTTCSKEKDEESRGSDIFSILKEREEKSSSHTLYWNRCAYMEFNDICW